MTYVYEKVVQTKPAQELMSYEKWLNTCPSRDNYSLIECCVIVTLEFVNVFAVDEQIGTKVS